MAKRTGAKPVEATAARRKRTGKAVRLDLSPQDHVRLERTARAKGLAMAAYARMALLDRLEQDDRSRAS